MNYILKKLKRKIKEEGEKSVSYRINHILYLAECSTFTNSCVESQRPWLKRGQHPSRDIYVIRSGGRVKIGSSANAKARIKQIQTSCPFEIEVINTATSLYANNVEIALHWALKEHRCVGEWFELDDATVSLLNKFCDELHNCYDRYLGNSPTRNEYFEEYYQ